MSSSANTSSTRNALALIAALVFPTLATWLYFEVFSGRPEMGPIYVVCKAAQFSLPLFWVRRSDFGRPSGRGLGLGILFGLATVAGMAALYFGALRGTALLHGVPERLQEKIQGMAGEATWARFLMMAVGISVVHSFLEEYYFRWFIFGQLQRLVAWPWALAISSLGFMAHHIIVLNAYIDPRYFWTATMGLSFSIAVGGAFWAWLYRRSGSLLGPWASHMLVDFGIMGLGAILLWG